MRKSKIYNVNGRDMSINTLKRLVKLHITELDRNFELEGLDYEIIDMAINPYYKKENTIAMLLQYEGESREDDMFNALMRKGNRLYIYNVLIDINPIKQEKSGTIKEYLEMLEGANK